MKLRTASLTVLAAALSGACSDPEAAKQQALENGNRYFEEKKYAEAILEYRNATQLDPRFGEARQKLADAYAQVGNVRASYAEQIRAADLLPDNTDAQLKAATFLLLTRQFEDAKSRIQPVLAREPNNVRALLILGHASAGMKDVDGAIKEIEQAINIDPTRSGSYTSLASLRMAQGDVEQARAAYEKAVAIDPKSIPARIALAMFRWETDDRTGSEETFKAAVAMDPKNVQANRALATYYMGSGQTPLAEPHLMTIAEIGGDSEKLALAEYY